MFLVQVGRAEHLLAAAEKISMQERRLCNAYICVFYKIITGPPSATWRKHAVFCRVPSTFQLELKTIIIIIIMLLGASVNRHGMVWAWEVHGLSSTWSVAVACWRGVCSPRGFLGILGWEISGVQPLRFSIKSAPWVAFSMNIFQKSDGFANLWRASQSSEAFCYGNKWEPRGNEGFFL